MLMAILEPPDGTPDGGQRPILLRLFSSLEGPIGPMARQLAELLPVHNGLPPFFLAGFEAAVSRASAAIGIADVLRASRAVASASRAASHADVGSRGSFVNGQHAWSVHPNPHQVSKKRHQLFAIGFWKRRLEERFDIRTQMSGITGAEEHDVDARLVPRKSIGGLGDCARAIFVDKEGERLSRLAEVLLDLPLRCGFAHGDGDAFRRGKDASHREHEKRANPLLTAQRKDGPSGTLVHHVKRDHEDVPYIVLRRPAQHLVQIVLRGLLGDADESNPPLCLLLEQCRNNRFSGVSVFRMQNAMQLKHVHIVGPEHAQRILQAGNDLRWRMPLAISSDGRLGCDSNRMAGNMLERLADRRFGSVNWRGVDEVDAHIYGFTYQQRSFILALAGRQAEPAESTAAETCHADS